MTATRRSTTTSPEKKPSIPSEKQRDDDNSRKRKAATPLETAETSRPKRNVRKSVLLASGDYEVTYPGVKEEEESAGDSYVQVEEEMSPPPPSSTRRTRRSVPPASRREEQRSDVEVEMNIPHTIVEEVIDEGVANIQMNEEIAKPPEMDAVMGIDHFQVVTEVDVETMSNLEELDNDDVTEEDLMGIKGYTVEYEDTDDQPPLLERISEVKRKRGRPRKHPMGQTPFRRTGQTNQPQSRPRNTVMRPPGILPRNKYTYEKPLTKLEAEKINSFNVKLFEDQIGVNEHGECYATVIHGCLSYLLRKERIIDLLTNRTEIAMIRDQGWMLSKPPRIPPLTPHKACFAFYVDGSTVQSIRDLSTDDLKPWTTSSNDASENEPVVKPNVRKHPIVRQGGRLVPAKGDPRASEIHLTEYSAWLPRCLRLRKKIFYLSRSGHIIGNVLILYDFTTTGEIPVLLNIVHGNEAFRGVHTDLEFEKGHMLFVGDNENPFEEELVLGPRNEKYLCVRPDRYGWTNNKKLLLRYLINDPGILLEQPGYLNNRIPYLPPLIEGRGVFVHFAPANHIADQLHFTGDGLSPWTYQGAVYQGAAVNHRVRTVKKGVTQDSSGIFQPSKEDWQTTGYALVETITILCRCPRLRKRILYVQRNNTQVIGVVCYIYEYMAPGEIPDIIKTNNRASNAALPPPETVILRPAEDGKDGTVSHRLLAGDEEVDVEELVEEVVNDDVHEQGLEATHTLLAQEEYEDLPEDSLNGGWDTEFDEDVLVSQEATSPFFDGIRQLEDGQMYLTVRHKRVLCQTDTVLEYIVNTSFVEDKGLVNNSKPSHPPLVRNSRAYVFFVSGHVVFPHDINRDDFSPWSANATAENPTCYRSKVRKYGVNHDAKTGRFAIQDGDYKLFPYHLVSIYSIHPKEARLRKRINYLMDMNTKGIISHVMIMYDYNTEGPIPRLNGPYGKRVIRRRPLRRYEDIGSVLEDVSDTSESEKDPPFSGGVQQGEEGAVYLAIDDIDFLNDRNRQLHYLINKPHLLEQLDCVNQRVPLFPPLINTRGAFVFFIDGSVDIRNLTCDGLGPWSENLTMGDGSVMCRRPKSHRIPVGLNRLGQLRVLRTTRKMPMPDGDFQMHIYAATLPRLPRLKKRVVYVTRDGVQCGHSMIAYWYSEEGEIPQPVTHGNSLHADTFYCRLPPTVRDDARHLLLTMQPQEVAKELQNKHGIPVNLRAVYNVKREMQRQANSLEDGQSENNEKPIDIKMGEAVGFEEEDSMADYIPPWLERHRVDPFDDTVEDIQVRNMNGGRKHIPLPTGRGGLDVGAQLFRYMKGLVGSRNDDETFDAIWKTLVSRNEQRVLHNIKNDFGVEIVADTDVREEETDPMDDGSILHEEILEGDIVGEHVLADGEIIDEVVLDDGQMMMMRDSGQLMMHPADDQPPEPQDQPEVVVQPTVPDDSKPVPSE